MIAWYSPQPRSMLAARIWQTAYTSCPILALLAFPVGIWAAIWVVRKSRHHGNWAGVPFAAAAAELVSLWWFCGAVWVDHAILDWAYAGQLIDHSVSGEVLEAAGWWFSSWAFTLPLAAATFAAIAQSHFAVRRLVAGWAALGACGLAIASVVLWSEGNGYMDGWTFPHTEFMSVDRAGKLIIWIAACLACAGMFLHWAASRWQRARAASEW